MASGTAPADTRFDVTSIGESMLRLSVGVGHRLASSRSLDVHVAGAETNVCAALAGLGRRTGWVSRLPDNPLGQLILARVREHGVDTGAVVLTPHGRVGTYFVELAAPPLPSRVTYDRAGSAFTHLRQDEIDWEYLLDTRLLHLTGITPALGPAMQEFVTDAVARARARGVLVSLDINYRSSLWSEAEAAHYLERLFDEVDLLLCSRHDARRLFGVTAADPAQVLEGMRARCSASHLVVTLGEQGAIAWSEGKIVRQSAVPVTIVDRIGAGDAFAAGVIDGLLAGDIGAGLTTGAALAGLALSHHGDMVRASREEVASAAAAARQPGSAVLR